MGNTPNLLDKSKDSMNPAKDIQNNSAILEKHVVKKEVSAGGFSPKNSILQQIPKLNEFKDVLNSSLHDKKSEADTKSNKGHKMVDYNEGGSNKKIGSVLSEESNKYGEENTRLKVEVDTLKFELSRNQEENQRIYS